MTVMKWWKKPIAWLINRFSGDNEGRTRRCAFENACLAAENMMTRRVSAVNSEELEANADVCTCLLWVHREWLFVFALPQDTVYLYYIAQCHDIDLYEIWTCKVGRLDCVSRGDWSQSRSDELDDDALSDGGDDLTDEQYGMLLPSAHIQVLTSLASRS